MDKKTIIIILLIIAFCGTASGDWTTPSAVSSYSTQSVPNPASNSIDDNTGTYWDEKDAKPYTSSWYITYDMGSTKQISKIRVYADGDVANNPCSVTVLKVCDDSACDGESDLLASDCTFSTTLEWQECSFTQTEGRYIYIYGGSYDSSCTTAGSTDMVAFYEFDAYLVVSNTNPGITTEFKPNPAYPSTSLDCNATAVDLENSTLIVEYVIRNGSNIQYHGNKTNVANNTETIIFTIDNLSASEIWNCTCRANDGTDYSGWNSSKLTISDYSIAIGLSVDLAAGIAFGSINPSTSYNAATGNNGAGATDYSVHVDNAAGTTVDLYIRGVDFSGDGTLAIANMTTRYNLTDNTVPGSVYTTITQTYSDTPIGSSMANNTYSYLKYWLDVPPAQVAGNYNTTLSIKAVRNGISP